MTSKRVDRCPTLTSVALRMLQIRNKTASIRNLVLTRFRLHSDIMLLLKSRKFALLFSVQLQSPLRFYFLGLDIERSVACLLEPFDEILEHDDSGTRPPHASIDEF